MWNFFDQPSRQTLNLASAAVAATGVTLVVINVLLTASSFDMPQASSVVAEGSSIAVVSPESRPRSKLRCQACGVAESIHQVEPLGLKPVGYEFTVRLREESSRESGPPGPQGFGAGR